MVDATQELERFAARMGITTAAADDLIRRLGELNRSADRSASAFDVSRNAADRIASSHRMAADTVEGFGKSIYATTKSLASVPQQIAASNSALTSISPIITGIGQMATTLSGAIGPLAGIIGTSIGGPIVGLFAGVAGKIVGAVTEEFVSASTSIMNFFLQQAQVVIDSFTQLSSVGATFGGSLESLKQISAETGLSFETLSKIAVNNAENLALLGGGTQGALKLVTRTSRDLGNTLLALYGGFENLNKETAEFMAMRRLQGVSEMATGQALTNQTSEYLYMVKELSALTGKNVSQLKSEMAERAKSAAAQIAIDSMSEEERRAYQYQLQLLPEFLKEAYTEEVVNRKTGLDILSVGTAKLYNAMPGIANKLRSSVDMLGQPFETMKENYGTQLAGIVQDTKYSREQFKDMMVAYSKGYIQNPTVKIINDALMSLGTNLGRLSTIKEDIKSFADQTKALKDNAGTFVDEVGKINKEQEKIRMALNKFATEGERFALALGVTSFMLTLTETLIEGASDVIPLFARKGTIVEQDANKIKKVEQQIALDPSSEAAIKESIKAQQRIDLIKGLIDRLKNQSELATTDADRQRNQRQILLQQEQIERFQRQVEKLNQIEQERQERLKKSEPISQSEVSQLPSTTVASASGRVAIETDANTKLKIDLTEFMEVFETMMTKQTISNNNLSMAIDNNSYQIKRLLSSIG